MRNPDRRLIRRGPPSRARAGIVIGILLTLLLGGCLRDAPPPTDPELAAELGLPPGTVIHRVHLAGDGTQTRILPSELEIEAGALVQFVVEGHRGVHALRFLLDEMGSGPAAFLRETQQTGSPPLTAPGARYILSSEDAPPGSYPFVIEGYGPAVRGVLRIRE